MKGWASCAWAREFWRELQGQPFRDDVSGQPADAPALPPALACWHPPTPTDSHYALQPFSEADWQVHGTWRRYIPEPHVSGIVILSLAPVWGWSVLVSTGLGLYATYAEVGSTEAAARVGA